LLLQRKATLLQEYKIKNKSNEFVDRRIGERNREMTAEDRIIARFTAERVRSKKKSIFNLADDEVLTHKGQTLNEIEKFDDPRSDDEDEDKGRLEGLLKAFWKFNINLYLFILLLLFCS
jgi:nucleolar protein 14